MYKNEKLGALDKICPVAKEVQLGTIIDTLVDDLDNEEKYSGELLSSNEITILNKMCPVAKKVQLGTILDNILVASKNGTTVETISNDTKKIINRMCGGAENANLGEVLQDAITIINGHGELSDDADILTFTVPSQIGESIIDNDEHTIDILVENDTDVSKLISTFTISTGASIFIDDVEQVSEETENDFTDPVVYTVISQSEDVSIDWTVTITVRPLSGDTDILTYGTAGENETGVEIDNEEHTVTVNVPFDTDVTGLIAVFTLSEGASAEINEVPQISGTTSNDFTDSVTYTITAEDENTTQDWIVTFIIEEEIEE